MRTMMLELEYDGSAYFGFQVQPEKPTIQAELEKALCSLTGEAVRVVAAGRTDAGVHARGQVVSFRTGKEYPSRQFVGALNYYLPDDIAVRTATDVPPGFDARRSALRRSYRYCILNRWVPSPFWRSYAYHFPVRLDVDLMSMAATLLVGEHDFASFAAPTGKPRSTVREIYEVGLGRDGDLIRFDISANGFLTHQVRNTVGTLIWVGTGKIDVAEFSRVLASRDRRQAGPAAPAHGLYFMKADYPAAVFRAIMQ